MRHTAIVATHVTSPAVHHYAVDYDLDLDEALMKSHPQYQNLIETYNKHPSKAEPLTGLIIYVLDIVTLPINPAIAAIAVLWILKLGLRTFCDYTDPAQLEQQ